jgi:hypothetical protein
LIFLNLNIIIAWWVIKQLLSWIFESHHLNSLSHLICINITLQPIMSTMLTIKCLFTIFNCIKWKLIEMGYTKRLAFHAFLLLMLRFERIFYWGEKRWCLICLGWGEHLIFRRIFEIWCIKQRNSFQYSRIFRFLKKLIWITKTKSKFLFNLFYRSSLF